MFVIENIYDIFSVHTVPTIESFTTQRKLMCWMSRIILSSCFKWFVNIDFNLVSIRYPGSGIRKYFATSEIRDPGSENIFQHPRSGIRDPKIFSNIRKPGSGIRNFFLTSENRDPGSENFFQHPKTGIRDPKSFFQHPISGIRRFSNPNTNPNFRILGSAHPCKSRVSKSG